MVHVQSNVLRSTLTFSIPPGASFFQPVKPSQTFVVERMSVAQEEMEDRIKDITSKTDRVLWKVSLYTT
jgi:hypothetical protein